MADSWSPTTYLKFADERTRAAQELLARVPLKTARAVVDVGCGPGNSTALLAARYPDAALVGIDTSPAMLADARSALPHARFLDADAATWLPDNGTDLVFANAVYQWVPEHLPLFPRIVSALGPGGVLAVQMPDNQAEPTHQLMQQVAAAGPWADRLAAAARAPLPPARTYYEALEPAASHIDIWHTVYNHVLPSHDAVVDWVRGTGLRPFIDPLSDDERAAYLAQYASAIADAYPATSTGTVLLRFPRLFIVAVR